MELPNLGQNCFVCNRNIYLPFKCSHCDKMVCIEHRTNHGSDCPMNKTQFNADEFNKDGSIPESLKKSCDFCKRITLKLELVECDHCKQSHCLYHRHQVQHNCQKLIDSQLERKRLEEERNERQKEALDRLKGFCKTEVNKNVSTPTHSNNIGQKKNSLGKRIAVMKIKQSAKGPPNVLAEDRLYFEICFKHEPNSVLSDSLKDGKILRLFTTKKHTIGRMIDFSAEELHLKNKNHLADADQLVFKKQLGADSIILDSQASFSQYIDSGDLEEGDTIIVTYNKN